MEDTDALITEWSKLTTQMDKLKLKLKPVEQELLARLKIGDPVQIPRKPEKIVKRDRRQLDPVKLQDAVSDKVWKLITEPKPVAARIEVAIRDGKLTEDVVESCSTRSKAWLAITKE